MSAAYWRRGARVMIANPRQASLFAKDQRKTDRQDALPATGLPDEDSRLVAAVNLTFIRPSCGPSSLLWGEGARLATAKLWS